MDGEFDFSKGQIPTNAPSKPGRGEVGDKIERCIKGNKISPLRTRTTTKSKLKTQNHTQNYEITKKLKISYSKVANPSLKIIIIVVELYPCLGFP